MHVAPPAVQIIVVPARVTVLLTLHNPLCSWTGTVGPSLPGFTIAPYVDSLLCYRLIRRPKSILVPKSKVHVCIYTIAFELSYFCSRLNLVFLSPKLSRGIDIVLVYLCPCGFDNPRNTLR
jgi:hypothetical protein